MLKSRWILNFPLGLFLGAVTAFSVAWFVDAEFRSELLDRLAPSVLSALTTLVAAVIAVTGVLRNIENQNSLAEQARQRKLAAARAVLPLSLSEFYKVCDNHLTRLANGERTVTDGQPELSPTSHETLKLVIENDDPVTQKSLTFLLMCYQVVIARYHEEQASDPEAIETEASIKLAKYNRAYALGLWASLKALVAVQFEYARKGEERDRTELAMKTFEFTLMRCKRRDGWLLLNDALFKELLEAKVADPSRTFLNPNYFYL
jgi:hypothetical protein